MQLENRKKATVFTGRASKTSKKATVFTGRALKTSKKATVFTGGCEESQSRAELSAERGRHENGEKHFKLSTFVPPGSAHKVGSTLALQTVFTGRYSSVAKSYRFHGALF